MELAHDLFGKGRSKMTYAIGSVLLSSWGILEGFALYPTIILTAIGCRKMMNWYYGPKDWGNWIIVLQILRIIGVFTTSLLISAFYAQPGRINWAAVFALHLLCICIIVISINIDFQRITDSAGHSLVFNVGYIFFTLIKQVAIQDYNKTVVLNGTKIDVKELGGHSSNWLFGKNGVLSI